MDIKHTRLHIPSSAPSLPSEWMWSRLDDVCLDIVDCPHSTPKLAPYGPLMARSQDILSGIFRVEEAAHVAEETYAERTRRAVPRYGDILYSREGTYFGIAAEVPLNTRVCLGQRMVLIRPFPDKLNFRYLRYWLNSPILTAYIYGFRDGTVAERLNLPTIRALPIPLPPLPEQRAIAHILGNLDDKIELNRRMNETLEAIARALFQSWFVDFDPVRAKAEGRDTGLPAHLADLFPDSFEESELGEVPRGWRLRSIGDIIERISVGKRYEQKTVSFTGKVPVLDQGRTGIIGYHDEEPGVIASEEHPIAVFANHTCYMRLIHFPFSAIQNVLPFIGKGVDTVWAYFATYGKQSFIEYKGHWPDFLIHPIVVADSILTSEFSKLVNPLLKMTWIREDESRTLAAIRDALLPKLLSGEIRVGEAGT